LTAITKKENTGLGGKEQAKTKTGPRPHPRGFEKRLGTGLCKRLGGGGG